jgi:uncharacterized membrane protein
MSQTDTESSPSATPLRLKRQWSWLHILLVLSLAANLFVIGAIAADRFASRTRDQAFGPQVTQLMPRKFLRSLDGDRRREIIAQVRNQRLALRAGREELKAKALAIADVLSADPYDAAALSIAVEDFGRASNKMVDQGLGIASEVLRDLTAGERLALAEAIRDRAQPRPRKSAAGP